MGFILLISCDTLLQLQRLDSFAHKSLLQHEQVKLCKQQQKVRVRVRDFVDNARKMRKITSTTEVIAHALVLLLRSSQEVSNIGIR